MQLSTLPERELYDERLQSALSTRLLPASKCCTGVGLESVSSGQPRDGPPGLEWVSRSPRGGELRYTRSSAFASTAPHYRRLESLLDAGCGRFGWVGVHSPPFNAVGGCWCDAPEPVASVVDSIAPSAVVVVVPRKPTGCDPGQVHLFDGAEHRHHESQWRDESNL